MSNVLPRLTPGERRQVLENYQRHFGQEVVEHDLVEARNAIGETVYYQPGDEVAFPSAGKPVDLTGIIAVLIELDDPVDGHQMYAVVLVGDQPSHRRQFRIAIENVRHSSSS